MWRLRISQEITPMSQTTPNHAYSNNVPFLITRYTFSTLGPLEQLAAEVLEHLGKIRIVEDTESRVDSRKPPDSRKTDLAQVRPDEASHRQPVLRGGGYPNSVLPLGGDHECRRHEGAGVFLGSYKISHTERQVTGLETC